MEEFLITNKELFISIASLTTVISLIIVLFALFASRKQNILKTAPLFSLMYKTSNNKPDEIILRNINNNFAYNLSSEPLLFRTKEEVPNFFNIGKNSYRLKFKKPNYTTSNQLDKPLDLYLNDKLVNNDLHHYIYSRSISKKGIYLFFHDAQNHRFVMKIKAIHNDDTINNLVLFDIIKPPMHLPIYKVGFWFYYFIRLSIQYIKT
jgi:hypothetical protein